jgi:hypothetical protein
MKAKPEHPPIRKTSPDLSNTTPKETKNSHGHESSFELRSTPTKLNPSGFDTDSQPEMDIRGYLNNIGKAFPIFTPRELHDNLQSTIREDKRMIILLQLFTSENGYMGNIDISEYYMETNKEKATIYNRSTIRAARISILLGLYYEITGDSKTSKDYIQLAVTSIITCLPASGTTIPEWYFASSEAENRLCFAFWTCIMIER